jgi:hypothetical protein
MHSADSERKIRLVWAAIGGGLVGAFNWLMTGLISGSFDPFDSSLGLLNNQLILAIPAMLLAWHCRPRIWLLFLLCAYAGLNVASYVFGSAEARTWFMLGAFTSVAFLVLPAALAVGVTLLRAFQRKHSAAPF